MTDYLTFAKTLFFDASAFNVEAALDHLHDCGYHVVRAKYRLLRPSAERLGMDPTDDKSAAEMLATIQGFMARAAVEQARRRDVFFANLRQNLADGRTLRFEQIQAWIHEAALNQYESPGTWAAGIRGRLGVCLVGPAPPFHCFVVILAFLFLVPHQTWLNCGCVSNWRTAGPSACGLCLSPRIVTCR